ncbi:hypothetical protein LOCC1_G006417 [Lachnellula occidentalis]|uniref:F-box domain-containing protein n=1 Tax=Lachnellula occidentalis TaxID=215460 RepID=A0A8H8RKL9_9HELO|nr:hypothetical protein LOCC1_G006417 [Lachnellula occidentalis]
MTLGDAAKCTVVRLGSEDDSRPPEENSVDGIQSVVPTDGFEVSDETGSNRSLESSDPTSPSSTDPLTISMNITGMIPIAEPESIFSSTDSTGVKFIDKGKGIEVQRGRTLERHPRLLNPLAGAESRIRKHDAAIEVDTLPISKRIKRSSTFHHNPMDPCAILDDNLLEPCPHARLCTTVSEVLDAPLLATVFSDRQPFYPAPTFPPEKLKQVYPGISHLEYLAIKSSSQTWATSQNGFLKQDPEPASLASQLPTEIINEIFYYLNPVDFNSARRICRSWFIASLDQSMLRMMLKRGGFSRTIHYNTTANIAVGTKAEINDEWVMSKRVARECALGSDWTGNGLSRDANVSNAHNDSAFEHISSIDFTDVAVHCLTTNTTGTTFTVSCCGKFVMAANGCLVYIYELNRHHASAEQGPDIYPGSLRPVTSIICPRRVLACSMDTSSHRYAIAILLDDRMGLVCDITALNKPTVPHTNTQGNIKSRYQTSPEANTTTYVSDADGFGGTSFLDRIQLNNSGTTHTTTRRPNNLPFVPSGIAVPRSVFAPMDESAWHDVFRGDTPEYRSTAGSSPRHFSLPRGNVPRPDERVQSIQPLDQQHESLSGGMPIETGPRSLYRNLCSDDDPPRSVAICPQRRCVAFGCSSGIELHWVDALTGQDLHRWFPLTAPSDFLFFLPTRRSIDSAKKLRLISSTAKPSERPAIRERAFGGGAQSSPFWSRVGGRANALDSGLTYESGDLLTGIRSDIPFTRSRTGRLDFSDHYRAVPLSDGYHILFTDPATDLLCMGTDAPVGGPTKLLRKIWFEGPEGQGSPTVYACGSDLSLGIRVVAAFGSGDEQSVWLFSVPGDIFAADQVRNLSGGPAWSVSPATTPKHMEWLQWWPDDGTQEFFNRNQDPVADFHPRSAWPVKIRGQEIGRCQGIVDLAVDSGAHMIIWAFSKQGIAKVWKINTGECGSIRSLSVVRDGTVREHDEDGDVEMVDAPSTSSIGSQKPLLESFDGTTSSTPPGLTFPGSQHYGFDWCQPSVYHDPDGDVLMEDLSTTEDDSDEESQLSFDQVARAGLEGDMEYTSRSWIRRRGNGIDFIEELTGVARMEIEIR